MSFKSRLFFKLAILPCLLLLNVLLGTVVQAAEIKSVDAKEGSALSYFNQLSHSGIVLQDEQQKLLISKSAHDYFIPASTTKLITALLSLRHWGADHRFKTEFYLSQQIEQGGYKLLVKGFGDPFLVSEELAVVAKQLAEKLKQQQIHSLLAIQLDVSYYKSGLKLPGASLSDNPYDAIPSALAANFNTINIRKTAQGFESAELQTPMTQTAFKAAQNIRSFKKINKGNKVGLEQRVNLGRDEKVGQRYFAELLAAFLIEQGIQVGDQVEWQTLDLAEQTHIYSHLNSLSLDEMIRPMMKYSTNFIANQLALNLSSEVMGGVASEQKVAKIYQQQLSQFFGWQQFHIEEGAGLSRANRLTPTQLIEVLAAFKPWHHLLPEIEQDVFAKSGSLIGVSTLAGYIRNESAWYPFVFMINQKVPYRFRNRLAKELSERY